MAEEQETTTRPGLTVRRPRRVEGEAVETERDPAHLESVLASLRSRG